MPVAAPTNLAAPDFATLVPIAIAGPRLGKHVDAFGRLCREELAPKRMAFLLVPPEGGKPTWFIRRSYSPALWSDADKARHTFPDLSEFPAAKVKAAWQKKACVDALRALRVTAGGTMKQREAALLADLQAKFPDLRVSRSQLYEWDRRLRYPADLVHLIDQRGGHRTPQVSPEAWAAFRGLYLHANCPSVRKCWEEVKRLAEANGWRWCGYNGCQRQLDTRIPPQEQAYHRAPAVYRQRLAPYVEQSPDAWAPGELWIGDHKQLDLVCRWRETLVRPWLTTWMDWRTRKVVGWVLSDNPNSTTILAAFRHGMLDATNNGGPAHVWIDNGKDYDAFLFHGQTKKQRLQRIAPQVDEQQSAGIFKSLSIESHFSLAYNPNGKARLARWFRTLEAFAKTFDTYTGDGPDARPEVLNDVLKDRRRVPSFDDVRQRIAAHIAGNNARSDHGIDDLAEDGVKLSPAAAFARWCKTKRVLADPKALDVMLMHWHKPVPVGRNGVAIAINGQVLHYGQYEQALQPFKGPNKAQRRLVNVAFDPHDLSTVRILDERFRYVCTATMNKMGGGQNVTSEHVGEMLRERRRIERAYHVVAEHGITRTLTPEEHLADLLSRPAPAAGANGPTDPPLPPSPDAPSLRIVQTPVDGQAREIERDDFRRKAVGAESAPLPDGVETAMEKLRRNLRTGHRAGSGGGGGVTVDPFQLMRERRR